MDPAGEIMSLSVRLPAFAMTTATQGITAARTIGMTASHECQMEYTSTAEMKRTTRMAICQT